MKKSFAFIAGLLTIAVVSAQVPPVTEVSFVPSGWNEETKMIDSRSGITNFTQGFQNYVDDTGWHRIDLTPRVTSTQFIIDKAPYELRLPKRSTGNMRFVSTNRYSLREKRIRDDAPLGKGRTYSGIANVPGTVTAEGVLYAGAFPSIGADLLVQPHQDELRWLIRWSQHPPPCTGSMVVPFRETFDGGTISNGSGTVSSTETRLTDFSVKANDFRGIWAGKRQSVWDSSENRRSAPVEVRGRMLNGEIVQRKLIPCSFFTQDTVYPVYSDDVTAFTPHTGDALISINNKATFAEAHDAADGDGFADTGTTQALPYHEHESGPTRHSIARGFFCTDTSALGDTVTTTAASLAFYVISKVNTDNDGQDYVNIYSATPASSTTFTTADFDQAGTTGYATAIDIGSITTSATNTWTFNATGIAAVSLTGYTCVSTREGHDAENTALAAATANYIRVNMTDNASNKPSLSVTWSLPVTETPQVVWF